MAPVKIAILPLLKNKSALVDKAKEIYQTLKPYFLCKYDEAGTIGRRYRRQDEIGTPYCVTVDFNTLDDNTVTIRDRDSMEQLKTKVDLKQLIPYFINVFKVKETDNSYISSFDYGIKENTKNDKLAKENTKKIISKISTSSSSAEYASDFSITEITIDNNKN
jgi:prolyl-tRNA synthetase